MAPQANRARMTRLTRDFFSLHRSQALLTLRLGSSFSGVDALSPDLEILRVGAILLPRNVYTFSWPMELLSL